MMTTDYINAITLDKIPFIMRRGNSNNTFPDTHYCYFVPILREEFRVKLMSWTN